MTFSLHAITLPIAGQAGRVRAFFGKGVRIEAAVRTRLLPEHEGAEVHLGEPIESRVDLAVRYAILIEQVRADAGHVVGHWYPMAWNMPPLYLAAAMRSMAATPVFRSSAEGMEHFRRLAALDMATMAAMMGTERTRVHRLEQGKSKLAFEDYRRLRLWAERLGLAVEFAACFPLEPIRRSIVGATAIPETPEPEQEETVT